MCGFMRQSVRSVSVWVCSACRFRARHNVLWQLKHGAVYMRILFWGVDIHSGGVHYIRTKTKTSAYATARKTKTPASDSGELKSVYVHNRSAQRRVYTSDPFQFNLLAGRMRRADFRGAYHVGVFECVRAKQPLFRTAR